MEYYFVSVWRNAFKERRIIGFYATPQEAINELSSARGYVDRTNRPGYWRYALIEAIPSDTQAPVTTQSIWHVYENSAWVRVGPPDRMIGAACATFDGVIV